MQRARLAPKPSIDPIPEPLLSPARSRFQVTPGEVRAADRHTECAHVRTKSHKESEEAEGKQVEMHKNAERQQHVQHMTRLHVRTFCLVYGPLSHPMDSVGVGAMGIHVT